MIIHIPEIAKDNDWVTIITRFEMAIKIENMPESVWYRFPIEFAQYIEADRNEGGWSSLGMRQSQRVRYHR